MDKFFNWSLNFLNVFFFYHSSKNTCNFSQWKKVILGKTQKADKSVLGFASKLEVVQSLVDAVSQIAPIGEYRCAVKEFFQSR